MKEKEPKKTSFEDVEIFERYVQDHERKGLRNRMLSFYHHAKHNPDTPDFQESAKVFMCEARRLLLEDDEL